MDEIQQKLKDQKNRLDKIKQQLDRDKLQQEALVLEAQTMKSGFWDDQKQAQSVTRQLSDKQRTSNNG